MSVSPPVAPVAAKLSLAKKVMRALVAAVTSTEAVKAEKTVAVLVVARVLLAVGASAGLVQLATDIISKA